MTRKIFLRFPGQPLVSMTLLAATASLLLARSSALAIPQSGDKTSSTPKPISAENKQDQPAPGIRLGQTVVADWKFGLGVDAKAKSSGISAFFPIPRDWPEQEIEIVKEIKSDGVGELKRTQPSQWTEQVEFEIPSMTAGQQSQVVMHIRIKKRMIQAPTDTPQYQIPKSVRGKLKTFLRPSPYIESKDKRIRAIAKELRDDSLTAWDQVEKNYRWVRENITYKFDPTIRTCLTALDSKHGDCEELSSLFIAICRCQGVPARAVWIPDHTYPEFYLVDKNNQGHWFPCQAAGTYAFGSMPETRPILQKGDRFKNPNASAPGQPKEVRYVSPSLKAAPGSNLGIRFIRNQIAMPQGILRIRAAEPSDP